MRPLMNIGWRRCRHGSHIMMVTEGLFPSRCSRGSPSAAEQATSRYRQIPESNFIGYALVEWLARTAIVAAL
jgi:hypothetical protein